MTCTIAPALVSLYAHPPIDATASKMATEAAYALLRLVRGVLPLSPGRKGGGPRTIETYRDYEPFVMKRIGGTVLVANFTAETCRTYQYPCFSHEHVFTRLRRWLDSTHPSRARNMHRPLAP